MCEKLAILPKILFFNWGLTTADCTGLIRRFRLLTSEHLRNVSSRVLGEFVSLWMCLGFWTEWEWVSVSEDEWWFKSLLEVAGTFSRLSNTSILCSYGTRSRHLSHWSMRSCTHLSHVNISAFLHKFTWMQRQSRSNTATFQHAQAWWGFVESPVYWHHRGHLSFVIVWISVTFNLSFYLKKDKRSKVGWWWAEPHRFC